MPCTEATRREFTTVQLNGALRKKWERKILTQIVTSVHLKRAIVYLMKELYSRIVTSNTDKFALVGLDFAGLV